MRVGVVGTGYWGAKHIRVLHELEDVSQVVAIDPMEERLLRLKRSFPSMGIHTSVSAALDEIDAAVIATPPRTHVGLGLDLIAAGKSVLIEKPLATSTRDAARLIEAAKRNSVTLMVGHTFEHNAAVWELRNLVRRGELGHVYYLDSARLNLGLYQPDVNVIWDLAPHDVSIFNFVLGAVPDLVEAWGSNHAHAKLEDVAYLRLSYEHLGVTANIHVSWLDPCKVRRVTVVGSERMVVYNDLSSEERIRIFHKGVEPSLDTAGAPHAPMSYRYGEVSSPYLKLEEPLTVQDRSFVDCARTGKDPLTNGKDGSSVVRVLECAERSLRLRRPVRMDEVPLPLGTADELLVS